MVAFYVYQKLVLHSPEGAIWSESYHQPGWQAFFDIFNSIPVLALLVVVCLARRAARPAVFFGSMTLHSLCDLLLHHDDAHRHFLPFSDWCFASPVSYWDPRHYGEVVTLLEMLTVVFGVAVLVRRHQGWRARAILGMLVAFYALYIGYALIAWA